MDDARAHRGDLLACAQVRLHDLERDVGQPLHAAARARSLLAGQDPVRSARTEAARWAATHPTTAQRVTGAHPGRAPAVRAWEWGGAAGLAALDRADAEPTAEEDTAQAAVDRPDVRVRRGPDGRRYTFRRVGRGWSPAGPPDTDPVAAVDAVPGT